MAARASSLQPSPMRRVRLTLRLALALLAALLAGGLTTAPVQAADDEHLALDGSYALPSAPARFSRDWSAGPGFGIAWVVPASSTRDWALRLGGNSFGYAPRSYVDSKVSLVSLTWAYRAILRENALSPYVRAAAGPALVGWQKVTTGYDRDWGSQGTSGWAGCVEVGGGISPPIPGASVRPFMDVSWVAAFTGDVKSVALTGAGGVLPLFLKEYLPAHKVVGTTVAGCLIMSIPPAATYYAFSEPPAQCRSDCFGPIFLPGM